MVKFNELDILRGNSGEGEILKSTSTFECKLLMQQKSQTNELAVKFLLQVHPLQSNHNKQIHMMEMLKSLEFLLNS